MRTAGRSDLAEVEVGLSTQLIYQDVIEENGFADSFEPVKRFVGKLRDSHPRGVRLTNSPNGTWVW